MQSVPCPWPLEEREKEDRFHQTPPLTEPRCCPPSIRPNRSISRLSHCRPGWLRALYFYYTFLCLYFMHSTHRRCGACAVFLQPILSTWPLLPAAAGLKTRYHATGRTSSPWLDFRPSTENVMFALSSFRFSRVLHLGESLSIYTTAHFKNKGGNPSKVPLPYIVHPMVAAPTFWAISVDCSR
jgi:hypothetical protein